MTQGYQHPVTAPGALRLHLNENTAGCSPRVLDAIRGLSREDLALYPDYERINAATAAHLGVPVSSVVDALSSGAASLSFPQADDNKAKANK